MMLLVIHTVTRLLFGLAAIVAVLVTLVWLAALSSGPTSHDVLLCWIWLTLCCAALAVLESRPWGYGLWVNRLEP